MRIPTENKEPRNSNGEKKRVFYTLAWDRNSAIGRLITDGRSKSGMFVTSEVQAMVGAMLVELYSNITGASLQDIENEFGEVPEEVKEYLDL